MRAGNKHSAGGSNPGDGLLSFSYDDELPPRASALYEHWRT